VNTEEQLNAAGITRRIRAVLRSHARLPLDVDELTDDADLFQAGMTSHASVSVMLALEETFDLEFPDSMLTRQMFESVASIRTAVATLETERAA
jgi:acyl carrier protein